MHRHAESGLAVALLLALAAAACSPGGEASGAEAAGATAAEDSHASGRPGDGLVVLPDESLAEAGPLPEDGLERAYYHSFGRVRLGRVVSHVFRLENTDPVPVAVRSVKAGCGCTVPAVRYREADGTVVTGRVHTEGDEPVIEIPPGAVCEVELSVDTRQISVKNSHKTIQTTIATDSPNSYYLKLETHVFVEQPFHLVPHGIDFGRVPLGHGGEGSMEIVQAPGFVLRLETDVAFPDGLEGELTRTEVLGVSQWRLDARLLPALEPGRWTGTVEVPAVLVREDGTEEALEPIEIPMKADFVPDLSPSPSRLVLVAHDAESRAEVLLETLLPGHRFAVTAAELPPEHADVLAVSYEPEGGDLHGKGTAWRIALRAKDPGAVEEILRGSVHLRTDDPQHHATDVPYVVHPGTR